jgi:hypothetical protein
VAVKVHIIIKIMEEVVNVVLRSTGDSLLALTLSVQLRLLILVLVALLIPYAEKFSDMKRNSSEKQNVSEQVAKYLC